MGHHTTKQAAKAAKISRQTLQTWIDQRKIRVPKLIRLGRRSVRLWTKSDITRLVDFAKRRKSTV